MRIAIPLLMFSFMFSCSGLNCGKPINVNVSQTDLGTTVSWDSDNEASAVKYEVEYGEEGFSNGSGTTITTTETETSDVILEKNKTYDFYVREYCQDGSNWSKWSKTFTYLAAMANGKCQQPEGLSHEQIGGDGFNKTVRLKWQTAGWRKFEYEITFAAEKPEGRNIRMVDLSSQEWPETSLIAEYSWDLHVRAICEDGSQTDWSDPHTIVRN